MQGLQRNDSPPRPRDRSVRSSRGSVLNSEIPLAEGGVAAGSSSRPEVALKSPRTAAGKAQLAVAAQKRGRGKAPKASTWRILHHPKQPNVGAKRSRLPHMAQSDPASGIPMKSLTTPTSHSTAPFRDPPPPLRLQAPLRRRLHQLHSDTLPLHEQTSIGVRLTVRLLYSFICFYSNYG